jgi:chromosomal replication initiation ATPase DnaA
MRGGNASPPRQLPLGLRHAAAMTRADFLVGEANREALALVDRWPHWPAPVVYLAGPAGSGKSHLVAIWREAAGAAVTSAVAVADGDVPGLVSAGSIAVEDLDAGPFDAAAMFHLFNLARERGASLLLTGRVPPGELTLTLPDLASRLRAASLVTLGPPDDGLLRRVLVKLFADRQLTVDPAVIDYIVVRIERSLAAANAIVEALDHAALAEGRPITRPLAAEALGRSTAPRDIEGEG